MARQSLSYPRSCVILISMLHTNEYATVHGRAAAGDLAAIRAWRDNLPPWEDSLRGLEPRRATEPETGVRNRRALCADEECARASARELT